MKRICLMFAAALVAISCFGQSARGSLVASISGPDRISLVRTSIDLPSWHEKSFWPLYETYLKDAAAVSTLSFRSIADLTSTDNSASPEEALSNGRKFLEYRNRELEHLHQYYIAIGKEFNGIIAMQFLQAETLLDMMETSRVYDNSAFRNYRFHPKALAGQQWVSARKNMLSKALGLKAEESDAFWLLYMQYESECNDLLGENYDMIAVYAGDPSDFTPALAKRLGYDLITLMKRETKLKEKYFEEINTALGPVVASRFLAWEDYYSLISKMHAWADTP